MRVGHVDTPLFARRFEFPAEPSGEGGLAHPDGSRDQNPLVRPALQYGPEVTGEFPELLVPMERLPGNVVGGELGLILEDGASAHLFLENLAVISHYDSLIMIHYLLYGQKS